MKTTFKSTDSLACPCMLVGHASSSWLSALFAGVPYNREKKRKSGLYLPALLR